jgi:carbon monoxide dehydrogenase subunit G
MAWIEGTEKQTFVIKAPYETVVDFFADPAKFRVCMDQLEKAEEIETHVWRWTLQEKSEKGITFQGVYTVGYERQGDKVVWKPAAEGTMTSHGVATFKQVPAGTEVTYEETIATDLPVPKLAAKVFGPIVAREIRKGVGSYLEGVKRHLESTAR